MDKVYAFEWCDCVYESAFGVQSLHATKAGAYRAMRANVLAYAASEREMQLSGYPNYRGIGAAWRVRSIEVKP